MQPESGRRPVLLRLYGALASAGEPLARLLLRHRLGKGKEDGERLGERLGQASLARPPGRLFHIHASSVGETISILPLIDALLDAYPGTALLLTTGTLTSARLAGGKLPTGAIHQFAPLDLPAYMQRFASHWRPDVSLFVESELWPNMLTALQRQGATTALINARMSRRSARRWRLASAAARWLLNSFDVILAQDETDAERLRQLGGTRAVNMGNLKYDAPAPAIDETLLARFRSSLSGRPLFLAASTHQGEDEIIADAHRHAAAAIAGLLTIIVPRHADRGSAIARMLRTRRLAVAQRSQGDQPDDAEIYIADTMGEMGLFYRIANVTFIGGSLVAHGGQNPIEPVKLDCAVLHGPHVHNFASMYARLDDCAGAQLVRGAEELAHAVVAMTQDPGRVSQMAARAQRAMRDEAGALGRTLDVLRPLLEGSGT